MTIKIGDRIPDGVLQEFFETADHEGCEIGPNKFQVSELVKGTTIAIMGLPGAFTPVCSAMHLPGFIELADSLKAKGVDEIWCISVNDAFVMGAWGREQQTRGKVRMMADGSGDLTRKMGLELDLVENGMGTRSQRYSMVVVDGIVTQLNVEQKRGKFEVSDASTLLRQLA